MKDLKGRVIHKLPSPVLYVNDCMSTTTEQHAIVVGLVGPKYKYAIGVITLLPREKPDAEQRVMYSKSRGMNHGDLFSHS